MRNPLSPVPYPKNVPRKSRCASTTKPLPSLVPRAPQHFSTTRTTYNLQPFSLLQTRTLATLDCTSIFITYLLSRTHCSLLLFAKMSEPTTFWSPLKIGSKTLKHRVLLSPMTRNRATTDLVPTDRDAETSMVVYYEQRATAGEKSLLCLTHRIVVHLFNEKRVEF